VPAQQLHHNGSKISGDECPPQIQRKMPKNQAPTPKQISTSKFRINLALIVWDLAR
jgi:hypothetical protein